MYEFSSQRVKKTNEPYITFGNMSTQHYSRQTRCTVMQKGTTNALFDALNKGNNLGRSTNSSGYT